MFKDIFSLECDQVVTTDPVEEEVQDLRDSLELDIEMGNLDKIESGIAIATSEVEDLQVIENVMIDEMNHNVPLTPLAAESLSFKLSYIKKTFDIGVENSTISKENLGSSNRSNKLHYEMALEEVKEAKEGFLKGIWEAIKRFFKAIGNWFAGAWNWLTAKKEKVKSDGEILNSKLKEIQENNTKLIAQAHKVTGNAINIMDITEENIDEIMSKVEKNDDVIESTEKFIGLAKKFSVITTKMKSKYKGDYSDYEKVTSNILGLTDCVSQVLKVVSADNKNKGHLRLPESGELFKRCKTFKDGVVLLSGSRHTPDITVNVGEEALGKFTYKVEKGSGDSKDVNVIADENGTVNVERHLNNIKTLDQGYNKFKKEADDILKNLKDVLKKGDDKLEDNNIYPPAKSFFESVPTGVNTALKSLGKEYKLAIEYLDDINKLCLLFVDDKK